jgi:hypothetical protein
MPENGKTNPGRGMLAHGGHSGAMRLVYRLRDLVFWQLAASFVED